MDIEGAEIEAFEGMSNAILKRVRCIAMEMHVGQLGDKVNNIYNRLNKLGFSSFTLNNPDQCNIVWFINKNIK